MPDSFVVYGSDKEDSKDKLMKDQSNSSHGDPEKVTQDDDNSISDCHSASTIDVAEENEKRTRRSLLFAILSACGMILCFQLIQKLISRFSRNEPEDVQEAIVEELIDTTLHGTREGLVATKSSKALMAGMGHQAM